MGLSRNLVAAACGIAVLFTPAVASAAPSADEQLRRLDIMLMVTSLRCRFGSDNFQPQYQQFSTNHLTTLNGAARRLQGNLVARHGAKGAARQLDQISVGMANQYGQGHPWLGCGELKKITSDLARTRDAGALAAAASELLGPGPRSGGRYAAR